MKGIRGVHRGGGVRWGRNQGEYTICKGGGELRSKKEWERVYKRGTQSEEEYTIWGREHFKEEW